MKEGSGGKHLQCWHQKIHRPGIPYPVNCYSKVENQGHSQGEKKKRVSVCLKCMANIWHDSELLFSRWWLFVTINRKTQTIIF